MNSYTIGPKYRGWDILGAGMFERDGSETACYGSCRCGVSYGYWMATAVVVMMEAVVIWRKVR